jgi:ribonuclease HII
MDDPLARFQREQLAHAISNKEEQNIRQGIQNYQAFALIEKTEKTTRLQIRCCKGLTHSCSYSCLQDVCYDGSYGTELKLLFSFMQVKIKGKNLQTLITAIEKHECAYIQDYEKQLFNPPKDNDAVIELIEYS